MRKITSLVICILMLVALAVPASAAEVPTFKLTADKTELTTGETVTITVEVDKGAACSNFGVIVRYDKTKFEFVSMGSDDNKGGMAMAIPMEPTSEADSYPGIGGWNTEPDSDSEPNQQPVVPNGKVGYVVLKCIVEEGTVGTSDITGIARVDGGSTENGGTETTVTPVTIEFVENKGIWGDADGNGKVNTNDAKLALRYSAKKIGADKLNVTVCDVDGNGKVNTNDAKLILRYAAKKITAFPVESK